MKLSATAAPKIPERRLAGSPPAQVGAPAGVPHQKLLAVLENTLGGTLGVAGHVGWLGYPKTYLHEMGHKAAVEALYANPQVEVHVDPWKGGYTSWSDEGLSSLGERLGEQASSAITSAAGATVDALTSCALFAAGYKVRRKHKILGMAMMTGGALNMLPTVTYAAGGIGKTAAQVSSGHDFMALQTTLGIPCWVSAAVLGSLIPINYLVMRALDQPSPRDKDESYNIRSGKIHRGLGHLGIPGQSDVAAPFEEAQDCQGAGTPLGVLPGVPVLQEEDVVVPRGRSQHGDVL